MKPKKPVIAIIVLAIAAGIYFYTHNKRNASENLNTIPGNGVIEATEIDIGSKVAGRILNLNFEVGDIVRVGNIIAVLESEELSGQVDQAQGNLLAAKAQLAELEAGTRSQEIERARALYESAKRTLAQTNARLSLVLAGPRKEQKEALSSALKQAQAQLSLVKEGPRKEQIQQFEAAVSQAKANLNDAETELGRVTKLESKGAVSRQSVDQATTRRDVASAQLKSAMERLDEAQTGSRPQEIAQAQAQVEVAKSKLTEALNGARPQEIREARASVDMAKEQVKAAKATLDLALAGARPETIAAARAKVVQAGGAVKTATATREQTIIRAPSSGRVILKNTEAGEMINPGTPIIRIAHLDSVWLRVYVPEPLVEKVKIGQKATVTTDAGTNLQGRVTEIAQEPEFTPKNVQTKDERTKLVFGVKIEIANPKQVLKPGMPADATIEVD